MSLFDQKPRFASRPLEWLTSGGRATYSSTERFFRELVDEFNVPEARKLEQGGAVKRLLGLREDFRQLMGLSQAVPVLQRYQQDINPLVRAIAVWLLSQHASRFFLLGIDKSCHDFSPLVRKRAARALKKIEARECLAEMAREYPDDQAVQWYASFRENQKTYQQRLENFVRSAERPHTTPTYRASRMPLWFRDEYWAGSPPKSVEYMRTLLRRIQSLVHG